MATAVGLLIVLVASAITALAERGSGLDQQGPDRTAPSSQPGSDNLPPESTSLPAGRASSTALPVDTTQPTLPAAVRRRAANAYARLPLAFVPNAGQTDKRVRYYAQGAGYGLYFTDREAVLALQRGERGEALHLRFLGADPNPRLIATNRRTGRVNYLTGSERHTDLPTYGRLVYRELWPGIDMVFRGRGGRLTYEFRLRPGAGASDIRLAYRGAEGLSLGAGGALRVGTPLGTIRDAPPQSFQRIDGRRVPVDSRYALTGNSYGLRVGDHRPDKPLIIDPSLAYSTYLGGSSNEGGIRIAVDSAGAAYVTGSTISADFPTTAGAFDAGYNGGDGDAFVTKLHPAGSDLAYSTYLGGSDIDVGADIAVDAAGAAYVAGYTQSGNFPTTAGAFDTTFNGRGDAFVTKLNPAGSGLAYSTYLGGSDGDSGGVIAVDSAGAIDVIGDTGSADFPTTAGAFDTGYNGGGGDAFVTKLNPAGSDLAYSTYLGGSDIDVGWSIAVDSAGTRYVTGYTNSADFPTTAGAFDTSFNGGGIFGDAFVTKLNPGGSDLAYSTYLGGSDDDIGRGIAIDSAGAAYLTGDTESGDFPATAGAFDTSFNDTGRYFVGDAFVTKLNPAGSGLAYSTYLGGSSPEEGGFEIAVDSGGAAYVTGTTFSTNFPTTAGAFDTSFNGGFENGGTDAFVTKLNPAGSGLAYSTYLGGSDEDIGQGIAIDSAGAAYVTGYISSTDFPTTAGAFDTSFNGGFDDAFVTKLIPPPPTSTPRCKVTNGGRITAENGDVATFGGDARSDAAGHVQGQEQYRDHGPAEPQGVRSIRIQVLICNQARTQATILGQATIDGSGMHAYEIEVQDLGDPGKGVDTYRIALDTGYDSGLQTLAGGDVQIDKP